MKKNNVALFALISFAVFAYQPTSIVVAAGQTATVKSISAASSLIFTWDAMMTVNVLKQNGYASISDWRNYICPALQNANVSKSFGQDVAALMGFSRSLYPCKG